MCCSVGGHRTAGCRSASRFRVPPPHLIDIPAQLPRGTARPFLVPCCRVEDNRSCDVGAAPWGTCDTRGRTHSGPTSLCDARCLRRKIATSRVARPAAPPRRWNSLYFGAFRITPATLRRCQDRTPRLQRSDAARGPPSRHVAGRFRRRQAYPSPHSFGPPPVELASRPRPAPLPLPSADICCSDSGGVSLLVAAWLERGLGGRTLCRRSSKPGRQWLAQGSDLDAAPFLSCDFGMDAEFGGVVADPVNRLGPPLKASRPANETSRDAQPRVLAKLRRTGLRVPSRAPLPADPVTAFGARRRIGGTTSSPTWSCRRWMPAMMWTALMPTRHHAEGQHTSAAARRRAQGPVCGWGASG